MADEWIGVVNTNTLKYLKGAQDNTVRGRLLLAMLQKRKRISFGESGYGLQFGIKYTHPEVRAYGDGGLVDFERSDLFRQLNIDWRGYITADMMTSKEYHMNKGNEALIKRYSRIIPDLTTAMKEKFGTEFYIDGYASGNETRLHGAGSWAGVGTTGAADLVAQPDDSYGGFDTDLGSEGGTWSTDLSTSPNSTIATDWPEGYGDPEYDWLTPLLLNWSGTGWTGTATWVSTGERVIRRGALWQGQRSGEGGMPTLALLAGNLYYDLLNLYSTRSNIFVPYKEAQDLGFEGVINLDGVGIYHEFGIPANEGYLFNLEKMKLRCLGSQLFMPDGPHWDPRTQSYLFSVGFFGNIEWNPKYQAKLKDYA